MSRDYGGTAFPSHGTMGEVVSEGMLLRDKFAESAMAGLCAYHGLPDADEIWSLTPEEIAERAYLVADAMLKERAK